MESWAQCSSSGTYRKSPAAAVGRGGTFRHGGLSGSTCRGIATVLHSLVMAVCPPQEKVVERLRGLVGSSQEPGVWADSLPS